MTADDVRGEDYEAARPTPARTLVTGDPWVRSVRGHDPLCPIARETWCVWTGDACGYCAELRADHA